MADDSTRATAARYCSSCGRTRAECRTPDQPFLSCCNICAAHDGDTHRPGPRSFVLRRTTDVSGVSGTGDVAEGVAFSDGTVALRWLSDWPTSVVFHDRGIAAVEAVHGHNGATEVVWL